MPTIADLKSWHRPLPKRRVSVATLAEAEAVDNIRHAQDMLDWCAANGRLQARYGVTIYTNQEWFEREKAGYETTLARLRYSIRRDEGLSRRSLQKLNRQTFNGQRLTSKTQWVPMPMRMDECHQGRRLVDY